MSLNKYISKDTIENIMNRNSNFYGLTSNLSIVLDNKKCFGKVVLFVNLKTKKKIVMNDIVEFYSSKIVWSSTNFDSDGNTLHLIKPHWCKIYFSEAKIPVPVKVLLHNYNKDTGECKYYDAIERQYMTRANFIKRRMLERFGDHKYGEVVACENMSERWWENKDYYKSHNETVKNYWIEGEKMKTLYSEFTNAKKDFAKEWDKLKIKWYEQNASEKQIQVQIDKYQEKQKIESSDNLVQFEDFKMLHSV